MIDIIQRSVQKNLTASMPTTVASYMIKASLLVNIVILVPVCISLIFFDPVASFGNHTPARGVLLSVYMSILLSSLLFLVYSDPKAVASLLFVQVVYKITTPFTVGIENPVVITNLFVACVHTITLYFTLMSGIIKR